jgi:transcriptional regulator GlxA family with amidase domain
VKVLEDRIFVNDDGLWTSAGATACIDLTLAFVEDDLGVDVAKAVAKKMVIYHRRMGAQSQHSALLEIGPRADRIQKALSYAKSHLQHELTVDRLAEVVHLSARQFARAFTEATGTTPAKAIERMRIEAAQLLLQSSSHPIETIAKDTGFGDPERMRRAFIRALGQTPQAIRRVHRADMLSRSQERSVRTSSMVQERCRA